MLLTLRKSCGESKSMTLSKISAGSRDNCPQGLKRAWLNPDLPLHMGCDTLYGLLNSCCKIKPKARSAHARQSTKDNHYKLSLPHLCEDIVNFPRALLT